MKIIQSIANRLGYRIVSIKKQVPPDLSTNELFMQLYEECRPFTMTSIERMYSLYEAIRYLSMNQVTGDFVECGTWKGGSSMLMAKTLQKLDDIQRNLYMYDTFEGMSEPTEADRDIHGEEAGQLLQTSEKQDPNSVWCYSTLEEVQQNISSTSFPSENLKFIKGKVEETIPGTIPSKIALLRLDTDWYESTKHELVHLFPLLVNKGVLIIDDYGYWEGARKAVDEYFRDHGIKDLLNRIDETGRIMIKTN